MSLNCEQRHHQITTTTLPPPPQSKLMRFINHHHYSTVIATIRAATHPRLMACGRRGLRGQRRVTRVITVTWLATFDYGVLVRLFDQSGHFREFRDGAPAPSDVIRCARAVVHGVPQGQGYKLLRRGPGGSSRWLTRFGFAPARPFEYSKLGG